MIYLSGAIVQGLRNRPNFGYMLSPWISATAVDHDAVRVWAADNGCFTKPERFSMSMYLGWLTKKALYKDKCLFATAPDVVGDPHATLARSIPAFDLIRRAGYRPALVAQDGLELIPEQIPWYAFDCLFIGGTTDWKLSPAVVELLSDAQERGKWTHVGRVNSYGRALRFARLGVDSVDGTYLKFGPDTNLPKLLGWYGESVNAQS